MKLLIVSLSVVFCFSCSKDTPTSPKIELDTSLKEGDGSYRIQQWSSANEEWVYTSYRVYTDYKWRFISSSPGDTLGSVNIKGGYTIEYRNPNPNPVVFNFDRLKFYDKDEILIAEDYVGNIERNIKANGNGSYSLDFDIDLDNIGLANEITRVSLWASVSIPR